MADGPIDGFIGELRRAAFPPDGGGLTDGQLLDQFVTARDEAAFAALVRRHGPMVLGICRRVVRHAQDAEDAFQATFLVLARKAGTLARPERLGNWLYGVAYRAALETRMLRGRIKETPVSEMPEPAAAEPDEVWRELRPILDEELARLPEKYREAVVLCDLQGRPRGEVARQLGVAEGTLSGRLTTARRKLAERLRRRGLLVAPGALAATLSRQAAADVPPPLIPVTVKVVAAGGASPAVAAISENVMKTMFLSKLKLAALAFVAVAAIATGIGLGLPSSPARTPVPKDAPAQPGAAAPKEPEWGEPVGGVRIRARVGPRDGKDDGPVVVLDLRNEGAGQIGVRRLPRCEVEIDGTWYVSAVGELVAGAFVVREGELHERFAGVRLARGQWVLKSAVKNNGEAVLAYANPKNRLTLTRGKHTVRVACDVDGRKPVSNAVVIEVPEPKK